MPSASPRTASPPRPTSISSTLSISGPTFLSASSRAGKTTDDTPMIRVPAERKNGSGGYLYPHRSSIAPPRPMPLPCLARCPHRRAGPKRRHCPGRLQHQPRAPARLTRRRPARRPQGPPAQRHGRPFPTGQPGIQRQDRYPCRPRGLRPVALPDRLQRFRNRSGALSSRAQHRARFRLERHHPSPTPIATI